MVKLSLRRLFAAAVIGGVTAASAVAAEPPTACASLSRLVDAAPGAVPVFLASYPTVQAGPLHAAAFLYDNAAAVIALIGCGRRDQARRIGDAILVALDNDRYWHDGRLRNGYAAGSVEARPVKLSGWWDDDQKKWLEDRYQVGSDNGNMAWAMLALLALDRDGPQYRAGAERIGRWVLSSQDARGPGGFIGGSFGHEPNPSLFTWKSTEHNTDLTAAFRRLADLTGKAEWRAPADSAEHFVQAMWTPACACFATGTAEDGLTPNPTLALDAQIWPLLALPDATDHYARVISTVEHRLTFGVGFAYGEPADGMWTEGTAQVALLAGLLGRTQQATALTAAVTAQRAPEGGYYATSTQNLPTGFMLPTDPIKPRLYFRLPHLGATAWAALAERRFNPFTASAKLP
jgi:hypothetical protein